MNRSTFFAIRHTMTNSSSKQQQYSNTLQSSTAAAAEVRGMYATRIHTRTSCSSVQYKYIIDMLAIPSQRSRSQI